MRKKYFLLVPLIVIFLTSFISLSDNDKSNIGVFDQHTYSKAQIDDFIREAYADNYNAVFNDQRRYHLIIDFFQNRLSFENNPGYEAKMIKNVSELDLEKKYNQNQKRDFSFNIDTFNPLKYKFDLTPQKTLVYKFGNTQYYMLVSPKR